MSSEGQITSLSEFLVCQSEQCQESMSICSRAYFQELHTSSTNNKKNVIHHSVPFPETAQYLNFISINRLHFILSKKIQKVVRGLSTDIGSIVDTALSRSQIFRDLFMNSDQAIRQYFYIFQIHRGIPMPPIYCFSEDFCNSISIPNQKGVTKLYKQLCGYSPEWNYLNNEFNYASGINSSHLEAFMQQEISYFSKYCNDVTEHKKQFSIREYTSIRNNSKDYQNDPYYYSSEFVSFLVQKYQRNPGAQQIFNLKEYYLHFWQYFTVLLDNSKNINKYFEEQVSFYHDYQKEMIEQKLDESFLGFRMWRINHRTSNFLPSLKNPFFLQTFIYSFIEELIEKKLFCPLEKQNESYKEFARFLHDYVFYVKEKNEQFNFGRYREYASFRRDKAEKLEQNLRKHKDIVFNMKFFREYAHNEFSEGNTLAIKKYKKYQEKRSEEQAEKFRKLKENTAALKEELQTEEKEHFYEILFNSFIEQVQEKHLELTKSAYKDFKQNILESVDETYIQQKEVEYKHALMEMNEERQKEVMNEGEKGKTIVKEDIDQDEEELAEIIKDEENSEESSDEEEREREANCPCCKGNPYQCQEPQCKILGCCSACMLGD